MANTDAYNPCFRHEHSGLHTPSVSGLGLILKHWQVAAFCSPRWMDFRIGLEDVGEHQEGTPIALVFLDHR